MDFQQTAHQPMATSTNENETRHASNLQELEGIKKLSVAELVNKFKQQEPTQLTTSNHNIITNKNLQLTSTKIHTIVKNDPTPNVMRPNYSGYGPESVVMKPLQEDDIQLKGRPTRSNASTLEIQLTNSKNHKLNLEDDNDNNYSKYYDLEQASLSSLILRGFEQDTVKRSSLANDSRLPVPSNDYIETDTLASSEMLNNQQQQDDKDQNHKEKEEETVKGNNFMRTSNHQPLLRLIPNTNNNMPNNIKNDSDKNYLPDPILQRHLNQTQGTTNNNFSSMATLQSMMLAAMGDEELNKNLARLNMDTMQIGHPSDSVHKHLMYSNDSDNKDRTDLNQSYLPGVEDDEYYYYGHGGDDLSDDYIDAHLNYNDMMHHHLDGDGHFIDDMDQVDDNYLDYGLHTIVEEDENSEEEEEDDNVSPHDENGTIVISTHKIDKIITRPSNEDVNDLKITTRQPKLQLQQSQPTLLNSSSQSSSTKSVQSSEEQPTNNIKDKFQHKRSDSIPENLPLRGGGLLMAIPLRDSVSVSLPNISVKPLSLNRVTTTNNNDLHLKQTLRAQSPNSKNPLFLALEQYQVLQQQKQKILDKKKQKRNRRKNGKNDHNLKKDATLIPLSSLDLKNLDDEMIDDLMIHMINSSSASSASSDSSSSASVDMDDACTKITTNGDKGCRIVGIHEDEQHDHFIFSHHHGMLGSLDNLQSSSDEGEEFMLIKSSAAAIMTGQLAKSCILNNNNSNLNPNFPLENRSIRNVNTLHQSSNIDSHHSISDENNKDTLLSPSSHDHSKKALSMSVTNQNNSQLQQHKGKQQQDSSLFIMAPSKLEQYFTSGLIKSSSSSSGTADATYNPGGVSILDGKQYESHSDRDDDEVVDENDEDDEETRKMGSPCDTNASDGQSLSDMHAAASRVMGTENLQLLPAKIKEGSTASTFNHSLSPTNTIELQIESLMEQMLKIVHENSSSNNNIQQISSSDKTHDDGLLKEFEYSMRQLAQLITASQCNSSQRHYTTSSPLQSINSFNLDASPSKQHPNHQRAQSATSTTTSNNSDYGSDTQSSSADCLPQTTDEECLITTNITSHHDQTSYPLSPRSNSNFPNLSQNYRQNRLQQQHRLISLNTNMCPILSKQSSLVINSTEQVPPPPPSSTTISTTNSNEQQQSAPVAIELCQKMIATFKKLIEEQQDTTLYPARSAGNRLATTSDIKSPGEEAKTCELVIENDRSSPEKASAVAISESIEQKTKTKFGQEEIKTLRDEEQKRHYHNQERQLMRDEAYEYLKNQINNIMDTIQMQPNLSSIQAQNKSASIGMEETTNKKCPDHDTSQDHDPRNSKNERKQQSRTDVVMEVHQEEGNKKEGNMMMADSTNQIAHYLSEREEGVESTSKLAQPQPQPRNRHKTRISYNQSPSPVTNSSPSKPGPVVVTISGSNTATSGLQGRMNIINVVPNQKFSMTTPLSKGSRLDSSSSIAAPITTSSHSSSGSSVNDNNESPVTLSSMSTSNNAHASYDVDNEEGGFFAKRDEDQVKIESSSQHKLYMEHWQPEKPRRTTKTLLNVTPTNSNYNTAVDSESSMSSINVSALTATVRVESSLSMSKEDRNSEKSNNENSNNSQVELNQRCVPHKKINTVGCLDAKSIGRSSLDEDHHNVITRDNDNQEDSKDLDGITSEDQHLQQQLLPQKGNNNDSERNILANLQQAKRKSNFYRPGSPVPSQLSLDLSGVDKTALPSSTSGAMIRNFTMSALSPRVATSSSTSRIKQNLSDDDEVLDVSNTIIKKEALKRSTTSTSASSSSIVDNSKQQQQQVTVSRSAAKTLALAQKYNYSPSLLVAAKLGDSITNSDSSGVGGRRPSNGQSSLQLGNAYVGALNSCHPNGSATLGPLGLLQTTNENHGITIAGLRRQAKQSRVIVQGPIRVSGEVCFSISFHAKSSSLNVHVVACRDLTPVDKKRHRSNPYIKLYLLPDRSKGGKRKSAIKKAELNPSFDEIFTFSQLCLRDLEQRTLWLSVWHKDRLGRNDFLGEVLLPLQSATQTLLQTDSENRWYKLQERFEVSNDKRSNTSQGSQFNGELFTALKFIPSNPDCRIDINSKGDLHIIVKEAHNLRSLHRQIGLPNPYCKCQLISSRGHRLDKQKSPILKRTINPKWNHKFIFNQLVFGQLEESCIELSVWDRDSLVNNELLGAIRLCSSNSGDFHRSRQPEQQQQYNEDNCDTNRRNGSRISNIMEHYPIDTTNERQNQLWNQMLARPNMWVYGELRLRRGKPNLNQSSWSSIIKQQHINREAGVDRMEDTDSNLTRTNIVKSSDSAPPTTDKDSIDSSNCTSSANIISNEQQKEHNYLSSS